MSATTSLTQLANSREGLVVQVQGGSGLAKRLDSMGIRPGAKIKKISGFRSEGPVTVQIGSSQLAIGHGMAGKVIVRTGDGDLSMRILLVGNPNVGKSVLFNRLTGANATVSNYPGTTVEFTEGTLLLRGERLSVIDVPGTYGLDPDSRVEKVAVRFLNDLQPGDIVVNVVDSTNLERNLNLTLQLIRRRHPMIVALNFWDETAPRGVEIDVASLEKKLGVPCVSTAAISGEGVASLVTRIGEARASRYDYESKERWHEVGNIVEQVQKLSHRHPTFLEKLSDASVRPLTGAPIALAALAATFELVRFIGEGLITFVMDPFFEHVWAPVVLKLSAALGRSGIWHDLIVGQIGPEGIDFGESLGLLTTGLYVPIGAVLPYVFAFYLALSFLEDTGYLPRVAVLADNVMHRLGLHGMGIIPMLLGLGCNVPGALATRIMESERDRFIAMTMMAVAVPCVAQLSMVFALAGPFGAPALLPIFGVLLLVWASLGVIMNRVLKGESAEILIDIPRYRLPQLGWLLKKVRIRIVWFLREAVPWVLLGVLAANLLYLSGVLTVTGRLVSPLITGVFGLPGESVGGLLMGVFRKDVAIGMLLPLKLTLKQTVIAAVMLTMYFPCFASFIVMARELGTNRMLKAVGIMVTSAALVGALLNLIL